MGALSKRDYTFLGPIFAHLLKSKSYVQCSTLPSSTTMMAQEPLWRMVCWMMAREENQEIFFSCLTVYLPSLLQCCWWPQKQQMEAAILLLYYLLLSGLFHFCYSDGRLFGLRGQCTIIEQSLTQSGGGSGGIV